MCTNDVNNTHPLPLSHPDVVLFLNGAEILSALRRRGGGRERHVRAVITRDVVLVGLVHVLFFLLVRIYLKLHVLVHSRSHQRTEEAVPDAVDDVAVLASQIDCGWRRRGMTQGVLAELYALRLIISLFCPLLRLQGPLLRHS